MRALAAFALLCGLGIAHAQDMPVERCTPVLSGGDAGNAGFVCTYDISAKPPPAPYYGTTSSGGAYGKGTLFEALGKTIVTLYDFCVKPDCADGANPQGHLVMAPDGALYGTTARGGYQGGGVLFQFGPVGSPAPGYQALWSFCFYFARCAHYTADGALAFMGYTKRGAPVLEDSAEDKRGDHVLWTFTIERHRLLLNVLRWWK